MGRALFCITTDHNPWLVGLAAGICLIASWTSFRIYALAVDSAGLRRAAWLFLTGVCTASGIWATHFVAMLAYTGMIITGYDPFLTATSLICAIVVTTGGFAIGAISPGLMSGAGGVVVGVGVSLMHFIGMTAIAVPGSIVWNYPRAATAILIGCGLTSMALYCSRWSQTCSDRRIAAGLLALAICSLHFTAMSAVSLLPDPDLLRWASATHETFLAIAVAGLSIVVMLVGIASATIDDQTSREMASRNQELVDAAIEGIVISKHGTIVNINRRISELTGRPPDELIGRSFIGALIEVDHSANANDPTSTEAGLNTASGRVIPVELVRRPLEAGGRPMEVIALRDLTERRKAEAALLHMATHDSLTGLPNRLLLEGKLQEVVDRTMNGRTGAVLLLDLDHFKMVNDTHGHAVGDALLRAVADRLRASVKASDIVARIGGDEFAIVVFDLPSEAIRILESIARRLVDAINIPFRLNGVEVMIGTSVGILTVSDPTIAPDQLLKDADLALYQVKGRQRGTYCFYRPHFGTAAAQRRALEDELRIGIAAGQLELHYQPCFSLATRRISGCEALVRWNHPIKGMVPPSDFIPLAEETGLINTIGEWVLKQACAAACLWPDHVRIAVNVSPVQFQNAARLVAAVGHALEMTGLDPRRLELEITESAILQSNLSTEKTLAEFQKMGVRIAMDDFGTGYSSLRSLQNFKFERLKIDRSFVANITTSSASRTIVRAVCGLAKGLGIKTTVEGVETREQLAIIEAKGCTEVQGYLFSKPLPLEQLENLMRREGASAAFDVLAVA